MKPHQAILTFFGKATDKGYTIFANTIARDIVRHFKGYEIEISIKARKKERSTDQNRYYWGVVIPIATDCLNAQWGTAYTREEMHDYLKGQFNTDTLLNEDTGEVLTMPMSTTRNSTTEMMGYMDRIKQWVQESFGVVVPEPNEQMEISFKRG